MWTERMRTQVVEWACTRAANSAVKVPAVIQVLLAHPALLQWSSTRPRLKPSSARSSLNTPMLWGTTWENGWAPSEPRVISWCRIGLVPLWGWRVLQPGVVAAYLHSMMPRHPHSSCLRCWIHHCNNPCSPAPTPPAHGCPSFMCASGERSSHVGVGQQRVACPACMPTSQAPAQAAQQRTWLCTDRMHSSLRCADMRATPPATIIHVPALLPRLPARCRSRALCRAADCGRRHQDCHPRRPDWLLHGVGDWCGWSRGLCRSARPAVRHHR